MAQLTPEIADICSHCNQPIFKTDAERPVTRVGALTLNPAFRTCHVDAAPLHLTPREFDLLYFLSTRAGKVCSKDSIFMCVWGFDSDAEIKIIDVIACKVRKKLGEHGDLIKTHWGRGYSLGDAALPELAAADNVLTS